MVEHDGESQSEVYDLTDLILDVLQQSEAYHPYVELRVAAQKSYSAANPDPRLEISWSSYIKDFSPQCGNLTDAINFGMPDGDGTERLRKQAKRLRKKADDLDYKARVTKLEEISKIRSQHPIAVVSQANPVLAEVAS